MKRFLTILLLGAVLVTSSCTKMYRDELNEIHSEIDDIKSRLDSICNAMNTNIASLQSIVSAMQNNDYVKSITPVIQNGVEIGYEIVFSKSGKITIYHGKDGSTSEGKDGKDGHTPVIGVKQDADGVWYWTVDGTWLLDTNGNKVKAVGQDGEDGKDGQDGTDGKDGQDGEDGKDGQDGEDGKDGENGKDGQDGEDGKDGQDGADGKDGKDGVTPQLKIVEGYWYVSYDGGKTWEPEPLGPATGASGTNGDAFFKDVDFDDDSITLILADGTKLTFPTQKAHDALAARVTKLEENVASISTILEVLKNNDYVTGTTPIKENGEVVGYEILFAKSEPIQIYYGKDGEDGTTPELPSLTVKKDDTYGLCWWFDDDYVRDANGKPVRAEAQDGISPKFEIRNGEWWMDEYGDGSWKYICKATGDSFFKAVNPIYETDERGKEVVAYIEIEIFIDDEGNTTSYRIPTKYTTDELEKKIDALQEQFNSLNALVNSLTEKQYIKEIVEIYGNSPQIIGYEITLVSLIIEDGKFVEKLSKKEIHLAPTTGAVGINYDKKSGIYYWTINGQELKDSEGNRIPASGENKVIPRVRIENNLWEFSIDGGENWIKTNIPAEGEANPCITGVEKDGDGYKFWLSDGTDIKVPSWEAFEELQRTVTKIETSIESIITFIEGNDGQFITDVTTKDGIITISYRTFDFEKNTWSDVQTKDLSTNAYITVKMVGEEYHWFAGETDLGKVAHNFVPQVKYEDGKLMVSTENGKWTEFEIDITNDNSIASVETTEIIVDGKPIVEKYTIKLEGGTTIVVPSYDAFKILQDRVTVIEGDIDAIQTFMEGTDGQFITDVTTQNGIITISYRTYDFETKAWSTVQTKDLSTNAYITVKMVGEEYHWFAGETDLGKVAHNFVPQVKYEDGKLMVSTENGKWTEFEIDITNDNSIASVETTEIIVDGKPIVEKYTIKLEGGTTIVVPSYDAFKILQDRVTVIEGDIDAIQTFMEGTDGQFITDVTTQNGIITISYREYDFVSKTWGTVQTKDLSTNPYITVQMVDNEYHWFAGDTDLGKVAHNFVPEVKYENGKLMVSKGDGTWTEFEIDITNNNSIASVERTEITVGDKTIVEKYTIKLEGGATIVIPSYEVFEILQNRVADIEAQISALQQLFNTLPNTYVTDVKRNEETGELEVYYVTKGENGWSEGGKLSIPENSYVTVKEVDGKKYFYLGETQLCPVDQAPETRIHDGKVYIAKVANPSAEFNADEWIEVLTEVPEVPNSVIEITKDEESGYYIFKFGNGDTFELPISGGAADDTVLKMEGLKSSYYIGIQSNKTFQIKYSGAIGKPNVYAICENGWSASATVNSEEKTITFTVNRPSGSTISDGNMIIFLNDSGRVVMDQTRLTADDLPESNVTTGGNNFQNNPNYNRPKGFYLGGNGGQFTITASSEIDLSDVEVGFDWTAPNNASPNIGYSQWNGDTNWLRLVSLKSEITGTISADPLTNTGGYRPQTQYRRATVILKLDGIEICSFNVFQTSNPSWN